MGLRDLTTASMVTISGAWLDAERARPVFGRYARLAPWLEDVEVAHRGLYDAQTGGRTVSPELATLNERAAALDALHDHIARGLHAVLTGLAELSCDRPAEASRFLGARNELFPSGLAIVNRSYLDEAGEASLRDARLSPSSQHLLRDVVVHAVSLEQHLSAWRAAADELGKVEADRAKRAKDENAQSIASLGKARLAWIGATNALLYVLDREKALTPEDRRQLLEPLESALAKGKKGPAAKSASGEGTAAAEANGGAEPACAQCPEPQAAPKGAS